MITSERCLRCTYRANIIGSRRDTHIHAYVDTKLLFRNDWHHFFIVRVTHAENFLLRAGHIHRERRGDAQTVSLRSDVSV